MSNRLRLRRTLQETEAAFEFCWGVLASIRDGVPDSKAVEDFLDYQYRLAEILFRLDGANRRIEEKRMNLVREKNRVDQAWFHKRIKRLGGFQHAIGDLIDIGRALGDAFAWFFYREEQDLLRQHLSHERITEFPEGVGAKGELEFIRNTKGANGQLLLYHGVTTILRHGDVSFVDLETLRVSCLGELKSRQARPGELEITVHLVGPRDRPKPIDMSQLPRRAGAPDPMPPDMVDRFRRQIKGMADSFTPVQKNENLGITEEGYLAGLRRVGQQLRGQLAVYDRCGEGLLLAGYRVCQEPGLRCLLTTKFDAELVRGIEDHVPALVDQARRENPLDENSLIIGYIDTRSFHGMVPVFWWPIDLELAKEIYFRRVAVVTVFNPAPIIRRLRVEGFEISRVGKSRRYKVTKRIGDLRLEIGDLDYFTRMVQDSLLGEDAIVELFRRVAAIAASGRVEPFTRIDLDIRQQFRPVPAALPDRQ
jgi:hypothetical protein